MKLKTKLKYALHQTGFHFNRFRYDHDSLARRLYLLEKNKINVLLDIGANEGQYAEILRVHGFSKKIISFEPLSQALKILNSKANSDSNWKVCETALGDLDQELEINVAHNSQSSSFLEMRPEHKLHAPTSGFTSKEKVKVRRLDSLFSELVTQNEKVFVKIDAQGFEKKIIDGAKGCLDRISGFQIEMSLIPLYQGELLIEDIIREMRELNFRLVSLEPGFVSQTTGEEIQVDGIFWKNG